MLDRKFDHEAWVESRQFFIVVGRRPDRRVTSVCNGAWPFVFLPFNLYCNFIKWYVHYVLKGDKINNLKNSVLRTDDWTPCLHQQLATAEVTKEQASAIPGALMGDGLSQNAYQSELWCWADVVSSCYIIVKAFPLFRWLAPLKNKRPIDNWHHPFNFWFLLC